MLALSALKGLAGASTALALLALGVTVFGMHVLWRLHRDRLTLQAAEKFAAGDMTTVVKRHVPSDLQSHKTGEEFILVRQSLAEKFPRWIKVVILFSVVTLSAGPVAWILTGRNWQHIVAAQLAEQSGDALKAVAGVWGRKYEFLKSCSQNAHTIAVTDGNKGLSVQYTKPLWDGDSNQEVSNLEYTIVGVEPNKLVLESAQYPKQSDYLGRPPTKWYFMFIDADTYRIRRSDESSTGGDIVRCR